MNKRRKQAAVVLILGFAGIIGFVVSMLENTVANPTANVVVYKSPTCGCCTKWADHMHKSGFEVKEIAIENLNSIKVEHGITSETASCHTAIVEGYVVEGHVPAKEVKRLLSERPDARGLTVPGMPIGSPGMEVEGRQADAYDVLLIEKDGGTRVWASY